MKKRTIRLTVENEYVRGAGVPVGAAGSHDEVELEVTFVGDVWIGTNKYVTFRDALGQSPRLKMLLDSESVIELSEDGDGATIQKHKITVPYAAKTHAGNMSVTFTGYTVLSTLDEGGNPVFYEGECINTMTAFFRVLPSDYVVLEDGSFEKDATLAQQVQSAADSAYAAGQAKDVAIKAQGAAETAAGNAQLAEQKAQTYSNELDQKYTAFIATFEGEEGLIKTTKKACDDANKAASNASAKIITMEDILGDIKNLDSALDSIIAIQESLIGTISFFIDGVRYTADKDMTWGDWINSSYNTLGIVYGIGKGVTFADGCLIQQADPPMTLMWRDAPITPNCNYVHNGGC